MTAISKELSLISGLVAIGNIAYEKHGDLEDLNAQLTDARQTHYRKNLPEQDLLDKYAPLYKEACKKHDLLDIKLGKEWKTRVRGLKDPSITIGDLFKIIAANSNAPENTNADISCDNVSCDNE